MARPYSLDLRERVVAAVEKSGMSRNAAAAHFGVGVSTVINWVRRWRETGSLRMRDQRQMTGLNLSADFLRLPLVKTHERPVDDRKAVYIVRNGRDCCRSLQEFWRAEGHGNVSLDHIIAGHHGFGSWSGHLLAWDPEARPNTLFLRFEQLTQDFEGTLDRLARFLEMRPLHAAPPKLTVARGGGPHWLSPGSTPLMAMTRTQEALFDRLHGVMARLSYQNAPS